nr:hypothetical protein [Tanacetum cinerariifolium]
MVTAGCVDDDGVDGVEETLPAAGGGDDGKMVTAGCVDDDGVDGVEETLVCGMMREAAVGSSSKSSNNEEAAKGSRLKRSISRIDVKQFMLKVNTTVTLFLVPSMMN